MWKLKRSRYFMGEIVVVVGRVLDAGGLLFFGEAGDPSHNRGPLSAGPFFTISSEGSLESAKCRDGDSG